MPCIIKGVSENIYQPELGGSMTIRLIISLFMVSLVGQSYGMASLCSKLGITPKRAYSTPVGHYKPQVYGSMRGVSSLVPKKKTKIEEVKALVTKHYESNKEEWHNVGLSASVGLGACLLFPIIPKAIGCYLISRTAYRAVSNPIKREMAKGYLTELYKKLKK